MRLYFCKTCRDCGETFYKKEVTDEQFVNLDRNPHVSFVYPDTGTGLANLVSICGDCLTKDLISETPLPAEPRRVSGR